MADEKKSNLVNDTVSKIKDAVTSDAVKNAAGTVKDTISKGGWKPYLTKKNVIIGIAVLFCMGAIGAIFDDEESVTNKNETVTPSKATSKHNKQYLRGPKILGLQLGMSKQEVFDVLSPKYQLDVSEKTMLNEGIWFANRKGSKAGLLDNIMSLYFSDNNMLFLINFKPIVFNASSFDTSFIKHFLKNYKIKISEDDIEVGIDGEYAVQILKNNDEGYEIKIKDDKLMSLSSIKKTSDIKFE